MKTVNFYNLSTGEFTGESFSLNGRDDVLLANIPSGCGAYEGEVDYLCQRVDKTTMQIVDYQPPQPNTDHEWNSESKRWVKREDVQQRENEHRQTIERIDELESKQLRPMRELSIDPTNAEAAQRIAEIDEEIAELRQNL